MLAGQVRRAVLAAALQGGRQGEGHGAWRIRSRKPGGSPQDRQDHAGACRAGLRPALEKQERKTASKAKEEALKSLRTVAELTEEFIRRNVDERLKRPENIRQRLEIHVKQSPIAGLYVEQVKPLHIDELIQGIVRQGKKRLANDLLRWLKRIFNYGIVRHYLAFNPASAFRSQDAGGMEKARERALSLEEIGKLFEAMKTAPHFAEENAIAVRLLLLLGVRKMELLGARWEEFNLPSGMWNIPALRSKNEMAVRVPLPPSAVALLHKLEPLACGSPYIFPRRANRDGRDRHMAQATLNQALYGLSHGLKPFTVHDFRRTVRTQLAAMNIPPHIAERCLNHKITGIAGVYDRYDYFEERKAALEQWALILADLEDAGKVVSIHKAEAHGAAN
ncbi:Prophage integrase IntA [Methylococcales bacterium]|nr:Prophage integrase IntA [Methylococcales bacterium]